MKISDEVKCYKTVVKKLSRIDLKSYQDLIKEGSFLNDLENELRQDSELHARKEKVYSPSKKLLETIICQKKKRDEA